MKCLLLLLSLTGLTSAIFVNNAASRCPITVSQAEGKQLFLIRSTQLSFTNLLYDHSQLVCRNSCQLNGDIKNISLLRNTFCQVRMIDYFYFKDLTILMQV